MKDYRLNVGSQDHRRAAQDYRHVGLSSCRFIILQDYRREGLSSCRIIVVSFVG